MLLLLFIADHVTTLSLLEVRAGHAGKDPDCPVGIRGARILSALRSTRLSRKLRPCPANDTNNESTARPLRRILGLGFGLAMVFGGTVGVGILRLPGTLAAALGDSRLIVLFWILGGVYALLGAMAVAELAAMLPEAGGFYVYARRAFGNGVGIRGGLERLAEPDRRRSPMPR